MNIEDKKLQIAQQEAPEEIEAAEGIAVLTDDDLAQVSGGDGDVRTDVDEAMVNIDALGDVDGF